MKLTGLGKFIILLVMLGIAVGGWRLWKNSAPLLGNSNGTSAQNNTGANNVPQNNGASQSNGNADNGSGSGSDVLLVTSASKKGWLLDEIAKFNADPSNGGARVTTKFLETRDAMHAILDGKTQPAIWSPSSTIWTARLAGAWREKNNSAILDAGDSSSYRVFFRTPLVFLTTKSKANFLRPLLGSARCWDAIADLGSGKKRAPWGKVKWAHADPLNANSGMMTLGLLLADFADQTGQSDLAEMANGVPFRNRMLAVENNLVYDLPAQGGSSALTKAFVSDTSRYDFVTAYENSAIEAATQNPDLAVIYPKPTAVSENVVAALQGDNLSAEQKAGAKAFIKFLAREESLREGLKYYLRPAQSGDNLSLARELSSRRAQGFQQSFSSVELPPYEALNSAAFAWRIYKAHKAPNE